MANKPVRKETIKKSTISRMKKIGVYKQEFDDCIDIYSALCEQYRRTEKEYIDSGFKYYIVSALGEKKKSPLITTLEALRRDILQYSDRLCLNPKTFFKANENIEPPQKSKLVEALKKFE